MRPLLALCCLLAAAAAALGAPFDADDADGVIVKLASGEFSIQEAAAADAAGELGEPIGEDLRRYKLRGNETVHQVAQRLAAVPGERSQRLHACRAGVASACLPREWRLACCTVLPPPPLLPWLLMLAPLLPAGVEYAVPDRRIWTEALKAEGDEGGPGGGPDDGVPRSYPESKGYKLQVRGVAAAAALFLGRAQANSLLPCREDCRHGRHPSVPQRHPRATCASPARLPQWGSSRIGMPAAWSIAVGAKSKAEGVTVCIVDSGVDAK